MKTIKDKYLVVGAFYVAPAMGCDIADAYLGSSLARDTNGGIISMSSTPSATLKGNIFKGPFHLPRMLMILNEIDNGRMIDYFK